jgi:hypothetical protein
MKTIKNPIPAQGAIRHQIEEEINTFFNLINFKDHKNGVCNQRLLTNKNAILQVKRITSEMKDLLDQTIFDDLYSFYTGNKKVVIESVNYDLLDEGKVELFIEFFENNQ